MNGSRTAMEQALKSTVVPWLRERGFKGSLPHFRRNGDAAIDLLTFQFDRHGGAFVVEVARCPFDGIVTHWGKSIPPGKATAWDVHPTRRKRIKAQDGPGTEDWFRFDSQPPDHLAAQLIAKLADKDLWHDLGPVGRPDQLHLPISP
jgi:Domain of unknown function (DUF4304)